MVSGDAEPDDDDVDFVGMAEADVMGGDGVGIIIDGNPCILSNLFLGDEGLSTVSGDVDDCIRASNLSNCSFETEPIPGNVGVIFGIKPSKACD